MRTIVATLFAALFACQAQAQWIKIEEHYVSNRPAASFGDIFWSTLNNITRPVPLVRDQWNTIDVTLLGVPADAKAIQLSNNLLISHANAGNFSPIVIHQVLNSTGYVEPNTGVVRVQGVFTFTGYVQRMISETANLKVSLRGYGDTTDVSCITCQWYLGHSVDIDGGQRAPWSTWVPVREGKIELKFECKDGHTSNDALSACGINLNVQAWGR